MTIIESESGKIDLNKSAIEVNDVWYNEEELKGKIKELIESDDFDVSTYTTALKVLQTELENYESVSFKAPKNVMKSIRALSDEQNKSIDSCLMEALTEYLKLEGIKVKAAPEPGVKKEKPPEKPAEKEPEEEVEADEPESEEDVEFEIDEGEVEFEDIEDDSKDEDDEAGEESKDDETEEDEDEDEEAVDETTCPRCGGKVPITSTKRPLSIKCPSCGKKGRLLS